MDNIKIEQLVISQGLADRLVAFGISNVSAFHWILDFDFSDLETENPIKKWQLHSEHKDFDLSDFEERDTLPAFTYEELRVLIGWEQNGIELREPRPKPMMKREEFEFLVAYPTNSRAYESGAEANGEWLAYLLQNKFVLPEEANERLRKRFNPTTDDF